MRTLSVFNLQKSDLPKNRQEDRADFSRWDEKQDQLPFVDHSSLKEGP